MPSRKQRAAIATETIEIIDQGSYVFAGQQRSIAEQLDQMKTGTRLFTPTQLDELLLAQSAATAHSKVKTQFEVLNTTTFAAAKQLIDDGFANPMCLNFASAKNPGGGFQSGAQAQEECLARASGLYGSLIQDMTYYEVNRECKSALYTNHLIYSPNVPVFRDDQDRFISPYEVSIITSPAVNAGAVAHNHPEDLDQIQPTMQHRIRSVLAVAKHFGHSAIVLGAWGCGVFRNDPRNMADWFVDALTEDGRFTGFFERVVFAVLDHEAETPTYSAFQNSLTQWT